MTRFSAFTVLFTIIAALTLCAPVACHAAEQADTLFSGTSAKRLSISNTPRNISITAYDINGGDLNYYYRSSSTSSSCGTPQGRETVIETYDAGNIRVSEAADTLVIDYLDHDSVGRTFAFAIPDPANRTVKSYTGHKSTDFGLSLPFHRSTETKWEVICGGIYVGMATPTHTSAQMHSSMGRSWEFGFLSLLGVRMKHGYNSLTLGFGIGTRNISTDGNFFFAKNPETQRITLEPFREDQSHRGSSIQIFSLHMPLLYGLRFGHGRHCTLNLGPVLNFNAVGSIHTGYKTGDNTFDVKTGKIHQRPVTVDAFLSIGWKGIAAYARYSPMTGLKSCAGLDYSPFSTGLIFFL